MKPGDPLSPFMAEFNRPIMRGLFWGLVIEIAVIGLWLVIAEFTK